jgi:hypothetical protein
MDGTTVRKVPHCRWCAKALRPNYQRQCVDCGHANFYHPLAGQAPPVICRSKGCNCTHTNPGWGSSSPEHARARKEYERAYFPKVLTGYGKLDAGKFCTLDCGLRWANKYAK